MDSIIYPGKGVRYGEVWFADQIPPHLADIVLARQSLKPLASGHCSEFWSIEIDLGKTQEALLEGMDKNTRYEIRRAENRDGLKCDLWSRPSQEIQAAFLDFYNGAASSAGRETIRMGVLKRYAEAGMLGLSRVAKADSDLAWHAYILAGNRARLWLSGSTQEGDRALIGRSNRYLHWRDMETMRGQSIGIYDFGGWYEGTTDKKLLSINQFKEQFGGTRVCHFDCVVPQNLRGKLYLQAQAMLRKLRR